MLTVANAGYSGFHPDAGQETIKDGVDYVFTDFSSEQTVGAQKKQLIDGRTGFNSFSLEQILRAYLELAAEHGTTIITNAGGANPLGAGEFTAEIAEELGVAAEVTVVTGDECIDVVEGDSREFGVEGDEIISANAYLGAEEIVQALEHGSGNGDVHVVIGGRLADPSMAVAPMVYEFGWDLDDWDKLGQATVLGHLLECDAQATGGYFMEPGRKPVPDPHILGFPYAEVEESGAAEVTKPDSTGGRVDRHTLREQLFYEIHDPSEYITPDVSADFSDVVLTDVGEDRVEVTGGTGTERTDQYKVLIGVDEGYKVDCSRIHGGPNAEALARQAAEILEKRISEVHELDVEMRIDLVGVDALYGSGSKLQPRPFDTEIELRVAAQTQTEEEAKLIHDEVGSLTPMGPAAGSFLRPEHAHNAIHPMVGIEPALVSRDRVADSIGCTTIKPSTP